MAMPTTEVLLDALRQVRDPDLGRDIVGLAMVHDLAARDGEVWLTLRVPNTTPALRERLEAEARERLLALSGVARVHIGLDLAVPAARGLAGKQGIPGVKNIVAVGSGKGGVGKTTVAVNMAIALAELGAVVGLMDADVYGPNVPRMMAIQESPRVIGQNRIEPLRNFGVKVMSMGLISPGDQPVIWRGPMLHSAIQQFLRNVEWGDLDYLIIDMPPGTGDVALTLAQSVPMSGAVVVTTPSDVSLEDARKALGMFLHLKIDVLGVVENMSSFECPHCRHAIDIFSQGGGRRIADHYGVPFLGTLPLLPAVREGGDRGQPVAVAGAADEAAQPYYAVARRVAAEANLRAATAGEDVIRIRA
ncbi:MAG: P-loop NTPase [Terriglobales bacterium]